MVWKVEYTDEFGEWWNSLNDSEQEEVDARVRLLEQHGPQLPYPHSSSVYASKHSHLRELRIQHKGAPYRILYAFDPRQIAILLIGGNKTGDDDWYNTYIPIADKLYNVHLETLKKEQSSK